MGLKITGFEKLQEAGPGNQRAFTDFVNANFDNIRCYAENQLMPKHSPKLRSLLDLEGVINKSFFAISKKIPEIREGGEGFSKLFLDMLKKRLVDQTRLIVNRKGRAPRQIPVSLSDAVYKGKDGEDVLWKDVVAAKDNPRIPPLLAALEALETLLPLAQKAIKSIKGFRTRQAAQLFYIDGLSHEEITKEMEMAQKTNPSPLLTQARQDVLLTFPPGHTNREMIEKIFAPRSPLIGIKKHIAGIGEMLRECGVNPETAAGPRR